MANLQVTKPKIQVDQSTFLKALENEQIVKKIQPDIIDYFTWETENIKRSQAEFSALKNKINSCLMAIQSSKSARKYFEGYELILQTRVFFLGKLGEITYTFEVGIDGKIVEINIDSQTLINLIFQNKKFGISGRGSTLRFNATFKHNLQNYLYDIIVNETNFELIIEGQRSSLKFENPKWMRDQLDRIRSMKERNYQFHLNLEISSKDRLHWIYSKPTSGSRNTSSVFSAVGHYAIDEVEAKNKILMERSVDKNLSPNIGNLTEIYNKAKDALNSGKNSFYPKRNVQGGDLFNIFQQVRSNTDPFYAGGDKLEQQIKSLLASMPSLASFKTIKKELQEIQQILNQDSLTQIKQSIEKLFIKNIKKIENSVDKQERQLAKLLKQTLNNMSLT